MRILAIPNEALSAPGGMAFNGSIVEFQKRVHLFYLHDLRHRGLLRRPNVVFPGGWIERNGEVILSAGWQDCRCLFYVFSWDEILGNAREITASW